MITTKNIDLITKLASDLITREEFIAFYGVNLFLDSGHVLDLIKLANINKSSTDLEYALIIGFKFNVFNLDYLGSLNELLIEKWHFMHEDIVSILGKLKSENSINSLYEAATINFDYLLYDEDKILAYKCIKALSKIKTDYAIEKIKQLAYLDDLKIRQYALEALENIKGTIT